MPDNTRELDKKIRQLDELHDSLDTLVSRIEGTASESLEKLDQAVKHAESARASLTKEIERSQTPREPPVFAPLEARPARALEKPVAAKSDQKTDRLGSILKMTEEGVPVEEIARRLGIGRGEVHLTLDLHRSGKRS